MYYYIPRPYDMDVLFKIDRYAYYSLNGENRRMRCNKVANVKFEMDMTTAYQSNLIIHTSDTKMSLDTQCSHYNDHIIMHKSRLFGSEVKWLRDDWDTEACNYVNNTIDIKRNIVSLPFEIIKKVHHESIIRRVNRLKLIGDTLAVINNDDNLPFKSYDLGIFTPLNFGTLILLSHMRYGFYEPWIEIDIDDLLHLPDQECPIANNVIDTIRKLIWIVVNA